jgi:hypothetical protein
VSEPINRARHSVHAPGPAASASASGEGGEQVQALRARDDVGHRRDGRRIVEVPPGRHVGQQQVLAHEQDDDVDVLGREAESLDERSNDLRAFAGVVASAATLADVVQQRGDEQQVRSA